MLLYHGTSEEEEKIALKEGLKPRSGTGVKSNWEHTIASNPANVYLTHCYAPYFAMSASKGEAGSVCQPSLRPMRWAIIEIDTDKLDEGCFLPDEDGIVKRTLRRWVWKTQPWRTGRNGSGIISNRSNLLGKIQ